jgi:hypothetical protein
MSPRWQLAAVSAMILGAAAHTYAHTPTPTTDPRVLAFQQRQVEAAEGARKAADRSAVAAETNARMALSQVDFTRGGVLVALFGPYLAVLFSRWRERVSAREVAQSAVDDSIAACRRALRHKSANLGNQELWRDLTELAATRNLVEVAMKGGKGGRSHLVALSRAYQLNFAVRDALKARETGRTTPPNLTFSDQVLGSVEDRIVRLWRSGGEA